MGVSRIVVLHTVDNVDHCIANHLHNDAILLSTHTSADVRLKETYGLSCRCLSAFLSVQEAKDYMEVADREVEKILLYLDRHLSPNLNGRLGFNINYFRPLYGYMGKYQFHGLLCFTEALRRALSDYRAVSLTIYPHPFDHYALGQLAGVALEEYVVRCFPDVQISVVGTGASPTRQRRRKGAWRRFVSRRAFDKGVALLSAAMRSRPLAFRENKPTIAIFEPLYALESLPESLRDCNLLYYRAGSTHPLGFNPSNKGHIADRESGLDLFADIYPGEEQLSKSFAAGTIQHLKEALPRYTETLLTLRKAHERYPIKLAIWGVPPDNGVGTLLAEFLRSVGVPIAIAQHGFSYGDCQMGNKHFDSDFNRCDYFLSYGFTDDDLRRVYPERKRYPTVIPVGGSWPSKPASRKRRVAAVFPLTLSAPFFYGAMAQCPPHELTERQLRILEYLDSLKNPEIFVKPLPYPSPDTCAVLPVLKRLANLKVVDAVTFPAFLQRYHPDAVILEQPATPLYEALLCDTEIFVLTDPYFSFEQQARLELERRVHFADSLGHMIRELDLFFSGKLAKKRDETFVNHYLMRDPGRERARKVVSSIIRGEGTARAA
jgi:hypothetical protein